MEGTYPPPPHPPTQLFSVEENFANVHFPAAPRRADVPPSSQHSPGGGGKTATWGTFISSYTLLKIPTAPPGSGARAWGLGGKPAPGLPGKGNRGGGHIQLWLQLWIIVLCCFNLFTERRDEA